ncbi:MULTISPECIES: DUF3299 domain-containing protein [unclassified Endozoicomonas]|uniref:DUF3299 domain-containing protein n=1 Tax=unclassified Endozoicomonas TaxID=2644528 RepID=UPI0021492391|nr:MULTISPECIES: DUF3299 domain-containing protein [unclassified Endozoicomonas]
MKTGKSLILTTLLTLLPAVAVQAKPVEKPTTKADAIEITWDELMPAPDQQVINNYQAGEMGRDEVIAYLDKLGQTPVVKLDKRTVKIPGYLVPLNLDKDQRATELLLVPTMGACIHVPPPPPNQTVYVKFKEGKGGIKVEEAGYTPYWLVGTLRVETTQSEYTETLYSITVDSLEVYK